MNNSMNLLKKPARGCQTDYNFLRDDEFPRSVSRRPPWHLTLQSEQDILFCHQLIKLLIKLNCMLMLARLVQTKVFCFQFLRVDPILYR